LVAYYKLLDLQEGESHHIVPRSEGGSDLPENLVVLPKQAHFLAHWVLSKAIDSLAMRRAFYIMTHTLDKRRGKLYKSSRDDVVVANREYMTAYGKRPEVIARRSEFLRGENNPMFGKTGEANPFYGKRHTEENKAAQSHRAKKENNPDWYKPHTEEIKRKIGEAQMGEKNHRFGVSPSEETRLKAREANKGDKNPMAGRTLCKNPLTGERSHFPKGGTPPDGFYQWHPRGGFKDKNLNP
jgi:hypothetical protein